MKIGVLPFVTSYTADPAAVAKKCEALGFESLYLPEHPILPVKHKTRYPLSSDGEIKELWTKEEASFDGEFVKFPAVRSNPKPARKPHPPVHVGAGRLGPSIERALRETVAIGDGWAPLGIAPEQLVVELAKLKK